MTTTQTLAVTPWYSMLDEERMHIRFPSRGGGIEVHSHDEKSPAHFVKVTWDDGTAVVTLLTNNRARLNCGEVRVNMGGSASARQHLVIAATVEAMLP